MTDAECLEAPLMGVQFAPYATDQGTPDANFGATVDGNYGFGDGCFAANAGCHRSVRARLQIGGDSFTALPGGRDYLVEVDDPRTTPTGRPIYKVTREEDINIGNGDEFVPAVPPSACAGPLHTVDLASRRTASAVVGDGGITTPAVGVTTRDLVDATSAARPTRARRSRCAT